MTAAITGAAIGFLVWVAWTLAGPLPTAGSIVTKGMVLLLAAHIIGGAAIGWLIGGGL